MKRTAVAALVALAVILAIAAPAGAETFHLRFKGLVAEAFYFTSDPSGCVFTFAYVVGVDGSVKTDPGAPEQASIAAAFVDVFDSCARTSLLAAFGESALEEEEFQIDRRFTAATLRTSIPMFDFVNGTEFTAEVDQSWSATGDTVRIKDHFQVKTPDFRLNAKFDGTFREASASGSLSDGTTNFTPGPAAFSDTGSVKVGEVAVVKE